MQGRVMGVCGQRGLYPTDQSLLEHGLSPLLVGKELHLAPARRSRSGSTFLDLTSCCPPSHLFPLLALPQQQNIQYSQGSFSPSGLQRAFPLPVPPSPCAPSHLPVYNMHFLSLYHPLCFFSPSGLQQAFPLHVSRLCSPSHLPVYNMHFLPLYHLLLSTLTSFSAIKTYLLWRLYLDTILRRNPTLVPPLPT